MNKIKNIKCLNCIFAKADPTVSTSKWTGFECTNSQSPYFKSLLNVSRRGSPLSKITWLGCTFGKRRCKK